MYNHNYLRRHNNSLVVCMWLLSSNTTEVNDLRSQLFCAKRGEIESSLLPPCRDCLFMHLLRANYQAAIWKCCLHARPTVPDPTKCGLIDDDGKLAIHWMRSPPAPDKDKIRYTLFSHQKLNETHFAVLELLALYVCPFL